MVEYNYLREQDALYAEMHSVGTLRLHLGPYFRFQRTATEITAILRGYGLRPVLDPVHMPMEIQEELWQDYTVGSDGIVTFPPRVLILGQTAEYVTVPLNQSWRMRSFFQSASTGDELPLRTNITAPLLKPGSQGHQTYEIQNVGQVPITISIGDIECITDIRPFDPPLEVNSGGQFAIQELGRIRLGKV